MVLIAGRYGLLAGLFAAAASIATLAAVCWRFYLVADLLTVLKPGGGIPVVPMLALAVFVGELRDLTVGRYRQLLEEHDTLAARFGRLAKEYTLLQDDKYLLEKAVLSDRAPLEFLAVLVEAMDTLDEAHFRRIVVDLLRDIGRAERVALYVSSGPGPMRLAVSTAEEPAEELPANDPVVSRALERGRVATVADLADASLEAMAGSSLQIAVPLPRQVEDGPSGMALLHGVPLATFSRVRLNALEVAGRLASRMAARIELHKRTQDRNVLDPRIDACTPFYLRKRGAEELARARDRGLPLSAVALEISDAQALDPAKEDRLLATLAVVMSRLLRPGQVLSRAPEAGGFAVLMPMDDLAAAQALADAIASEVEGFRMRPYRDDRSLAIRARPVAIHPGCETWAAAERELFGPPKEESR
ncbi:MAG: GAF domain-containing protein [Candidatus Wallbacteria bacterium]|nr:GAF domain-containing protein [Candidatus Wallbacteria bacterium]